ncbi:curli production assembly/transport component CsgF [Pontibacter chinhatensis]|uniref:Curli production assembly/transport component CsgF n=1 Tax=Pontibacter chinhatensis TaxID=1436961 RepID=A0A1I2WHW5_9BACT|nr:curli production assembly/transport component CsgF [Pontibacter chinhatensis]SFH00932.1 curli production assembly/transport component CsgF [Pontibacter chinhatensis]
MRKFILPLMASLVLVLVNLVSVQAQDLVYTPKNPAFGGNPYNYSWLQSSAQSQDKLKDPNATSGSGINRDPLEDFKSSLNRQILNELSRKLIANQFGEDGVTPGSYTLGDYQIDVTEGPGGVNIEIVDIGTGNRTTVTIPYY